MSYSYTWTYLASKPKQAKRLIGISYENFIQLISLAKKIDENHQENLEEKKTRLSRPGGGAKPILLVSDKILLTLMYLCQGLTFQVLGLHFHVSESTAYTYFSYWQEILSNALPMSLDKGDILLNHPCQVTSAPSLIEDVKNHEENEEELSKLLR